MKILCVASMILFLIVLINLINAKNCEGFDNESSYNSCINKGFTKEFCLQTPNSISPGTCRCDNGSIGYYLPGFGGECMCGYYN